MKRYCGSFDYDSKSGVRTRQFNFECDTGNDFTQLKINPDEHKSFAWYSLDRIDQSNLSDPIREVVFRSFEN